MIRVRKTLRHHLVHSSVPIRNSSRPPIFRTHVCPRMQLLWSKTRPNNRCSGISLTNKVSHEFPAALSVRRISENSLSVGELPRFRSLLDSAELIAEAQE